MPYEHELEVALEAARDAGAVLLRHYETGSETWEKSKDNPVTAADLESDRVIAKHLTNAFPEDALLSEETVADPARTEAIAETLRSGRVCYFSRSRQKLWRKGERSGQTQALVDFRIDCDGDTLLLQVEQKGVACHTGRHNCFFNAIRNDKIKAIADVVVDPKELYGK